MAAVAGAIAVVLILIVGLVALLARRRSRVSHAASDPLASAALANAEQIIEQSERTAKESLERKHGPSTPGSGRTD